MGAYAAVAGIATGAPAIVALMITPDRAGRVSGTAAAVAVLLIAVFTHGFAQQKTAKHRHPALTNIVVIAVVILLHAPGLRHITWDLLLETRARVIPRIAAYLRTVAVVNAILLRGVIHAVAIVVIFVVIAAF